MEALEPSSTKYYINLTNVCFLHVETSTNNSCSSSNPTYAMADWELALIATSSSNQSPLPENKLASSIFITNDKLKKKRNGNNKT